MTPRNRGALQNVVAAAVVLATLCVLSYAVWGGFAFAFAGGINVGLAVAFLLVLYAYPE
jgi:hypothetical protein